MKRVRALIQPDIQTNAQNGVDNLSLTFASVIAGRDVEGKFFILCFKESKNNLFYHLSRTCIVIS